MSETEQRERGRPRIQDYFTATELSGGKDRSLLAAEHRERKAEKEEEERLTALAKKYGIPVEDPPEQELNKDIKKFDVRHKLVLALHMAGKSQVQIATEIGVHYLFVHKTLHSPKAQELLAKWKETLELELQGLQPLAIDAVRKGLQSNDRDVQLKAVDRFVKLTGGEGNGTSVTVNVVNNARDRFIGGLRDLAEGQELIEGSVSEPEAEAEDAEFEDIA